MPTYRASPLITRPGMVSAVRYDSSAILGGGKTTIALVANVLYLVPFIPVHASRVRGLAMTTDRISLRVTAASAAGKKGRMGIYLPSSTGLAGALVSGSDSGEFAEDTAAPFDLDQTITAVLISGNLYLLGIVGDGAPTVASYSNTGSPTGLAAINDNSQRAAYSASSAYTAGVSTMPNPAPTVAGGVAVMPAIQIRFA